MSIIPIEPKLRAKTPKAPGNLKPHASFKAELIKKSTSLQEAKILPKEELKKIAMDLKSDNLSDEEVSQKFVSLVLEKSFLAKQTDLTKIIKNTFADNPDFNDSLIKNLKILS